MNEMHTTLVNRLFYYISSLAIVIFLRTTLCYTFYMEPQKQTPQSGMQMTLGIAAFLLGIAWIIGYFVMHMGGRTHLLLALAAVLTFVRITITKPNTL